MLFLKLFLITNVVILLSLVDSEKMSLRDRKICLSCLDVVNRLKYVKSSSICDTINNPIESIRLLNPQTELMCYEVYYYFYFFDQNYLYNNLMEDNNTNDCKVCSYLDKCAFNECSASNNIDDKIKVVQPKNNEKQKEFESNVENVKFTSIETKIKPNAEEKSENIIFDHLVVVKTKIHHILDELFNLGTIHNTAKEIKKKLINLFIFYKLNKEKKLNILGNSTILKIKNKDDSKNFLENINKLSNKLLDLYTKYSIQLENKAELILNKDFNLSNHTNVDNSVHYLTHITQVCNEINKLSQAIFNSNTKIFHSILSEFTWDKLFKETENNKNKKQIISKLDSTNMMIPSNSMLIPADELKLLINKISILEKEQQNLKQIINEKNKFKHIQNQSSQSTLLINKKDNVQPDHFQKKDKSTSHLNIDKFNGNISKSRFTNSSLINDIKSQIPNSQHIIDANIAKDKKQTSVLNAKAFNTTVSVKSSEHIFPKNVSTSLKNLNTYKIVKNNFDKTVNDSAKYPLLSNITLNNYSISNTNSSIKNINKTFPHKNYFPSNLNNTSNSKISAIMNKKFLNKISEKPLVNMNDIINQEKFPISIEINELNKISKNSSTGHINKYKRSIYIPPDILPQKYLPKKKKIKKLKKFLKN